jgi:hypothetical protein
VTWAAWKRDAECGCTDPDPAACTSWCEPSPQYTRECPCHYLTNRAQDEAHAAADGPPDPSPAAPDAPTVADAQAMLRRMADAACSDTDGFCDVHGFHRHAPAPDGLREQYMAAIIRGGGCVDLAAATDAVLAVRDEELLRLRAETATAEDLTTAQAAIERVRKLASQWAILRTYGSAAYELRKVLDEKEASQPQVVHSTTEQQASASPGVDELATAQAAVARVHDLHTGWLSTGAPPLGTSIARWWDKRLIELAAALDEPRDGAGADTARHCGSTLPHPSHTFMRLHVVFNCPGNTPKDPS